VPELVQLLQDENAETRAHAAFALNWIGPGASDGVPELIRSLRTTQIRFGRARRLPCCVLGPEAKDAVPALILALQDADQEVRRVAAMAFKEVDRNAAATEGV
jgi:HEAT repeat protein